jgi:hypothetical protein
MGSNTRWIVIAAGAVLALSAPAAAEVVEIPVDEPEWQTVLTLEGLRRSQYVWSAKVHNAQNDPRKICVAFDLLDAAKTILSTSVRCIVVPPNGDATVEGDAYVEMDLIGRVKSHQALGTSNPIYYPATPPPPAP